jgi:signal transduction histidine kinase
VKQVRKAGQYFQLDETALSECIPWWRRGPIGYIAACLMVAASIGVTQLGEVLLLEPSYIAVSVLLLSVLLASFFWRVGPGLLASLLGSLVLVYFLVRLQSALLGWELLFRLGPFIITSLIIAILTGQREIARQFIQKRANELSAMNQELERANHLKDYFMIRAAHELRTPLTAILGETQLALRRLNKVESTKATYQKSFEKVEKRAKHLCALIEDLLEISRVRSGEIPLHLAPCDFGKLCLEVVEDQRALSGRQIIYEVPSQPLTLQADSMRLSLAVINLVENAVRYSSEQTAIRVSISADQVGVLLQVSNEEFGLTPEQQKRIFEPFYRTPFAENTFREGWGLGLTVSREIAERHHGRLWVESEKGSNTTFFMYIPFSFEEIYSLAV